MSGHSDRGAVRWWPRVLAAFLVWLVATAAAYLGGNHPRPLVMALVVATAAGALWLFLDASAVVETTRWPRPEPDPVRPVGEDARTALLQRVISSQLESRQVNDQLRLHLADIADRQLMLHHGVTMERDPSQAEGLLGPELVDYLGRDTPPRLSTTQIDRMLTRIEDL